MVFIRKLEDLYTNIEKASIKLECEVNKENVRCVWKRYGKQIEEDDRIKIESEGRIQRLTISNLNLNDKQNISCVAVRGRNDEDELASTSTKIIIKG